MGAIRGTRTILILFFRVSVEGLFWPRCRLSCIPQAPPLPETPRRKTAWNRRRESAISGARVTVNYLDAWVSRSASHLRIPGLASKRENQSWNRFYAGTSPVANYLISTVAPASVNFFLMVSASSFETPSFTVFGAPSTRSLASFKPRLVTSRTALITLILLAPTAVRTTANSVFSSAGAAAAAAAAASHHDRGCRRCRNAQTLFQFLYQCCRIQQRQANDLFFNCCKSAMCFSTFSLLL